MGKVLLILAVLALAPCVGRGQKKQVAGDEQVTAPGTTHREIDDFPAQVMKESDRMIVQNFIQIIESGDRQAISDIVRYPLGRGASRPPIGDKSEFIALFDEIFDDNILNIIENSNPATDWSEVGWRGIMLLDGRIWLDSDGKLIAVN